MLASAKTHFGSKTQTKDVFLKVCLWIVRVLIIISCAVVFSRLLILPEFLTELTNPCPCSRQEFLMTI
jgi:hypothetical protein